MSWKKKTICEIIDNVDNIHLTLKLMEICGEPEHWFT